MNNLDWIEIDHHHQTGEPYFTFNNTDWYLGEFMKLDSTNQWHGVLTLTNNHALAIKISDCGDAVQASYID